MWAEQVTKEFAKCLSILRSGIPVEPGSEDFQKSWKGRFDMKTYFFILSNLLYHL